MADKDIVLAASCVAPEIQTVINRWLSGQSFLSSCVRVAIEGGVKNREVLMAQVRSAVKNYGVRRTFLFSHLGCRAYKSRKFANTQLEREALENDLKNTKAAIEAEFPKLKVNIFITDKTGKINEAE